MPDTFTPVLNLTQPEVGASDSTWGTKLNADLATLDALFAGTGTGTLLRRDASDNAATVGVVISKAAGNARRVQFQTAGSLRWDLGANSVAEGGANAGSDYALQRYTDAGALLGTPFTVSRATGQVTFETTPQVGANAIRTVANDSDLRTPIGAGQIWFGSRTVDPGGGTYWMVANGRAIDRTVYAAYFAVVGTAYGAGNGSTTFNIPNCEERTLVGQSAAQTLIPQFNATVLGNTFGEGKHQLTVAELAVHNHGGLTGGHTHTFNDSGNAGLNGVTGGAGTFFYTHGAVGVTASAQDTIATDGSGTAHNNVQPSLVVNFIVRVQ